MKVWFTSDTHFHHRKVAELRGFDSPEEHDAEITDRWNAAVASEDIVWHLGDVGLGRDSQIITTVKKLNGHKHLITGNHDSCWPGHRDAHKRTRAWLEAFGSVQAYAKRRIGNHTVLLSHFPFLGGGDHTGQERYSEFRFTEGAYWLLHGHTHSNLVNFPNVKQVHVGLDAWGLKPVETGQIQRILDNPLLIRSKSYLRRAMEQE